jgi:hypothetical protein
MRRIYFLVPSVASARLIVDELLLARIEERHIHIVRARTRRWKTCRRPAWRSAATSCRRWSAAWLPAAWPGCWPAHWR